MLDLVLDTVVAHRLLFTALARLAKMSFPDNTPESKYAPDAWARARAIRRKGRLVGSVGSAVNLLRHNFALLLEGALCSKKFATETKLQRRFVWLSPSKKFLCYTKTATRPPDCESDLQIIALVRRFERAFVYTCTDMHRWCTYILHIHSAASSLYVGSNMHTCAHLFARTILVRTRGHVHACMH